MIAPSAADSDSDSAAGSDSAADSDFGSDSDSAAGSGSDSTAAEGSAAAAALAPSAPAPCGLEPGPGPAPGGAGGEAAVWLVLTTFPDSETARQIGTQMVREQLAACVNLLSPCESLYQWRGALESSREIPALLKTTRGRFPALEAALRAAHPYEVPEIVALPVAGGSAAYLAWVAAGCGG